MPTPTTPRAEGPSRRAVLAGALVLAGGVLSACTTDPASDGARPGRPAQPDVDPDVALAATALGDVQQMLELVRATGERHPRLREVLSSALAVHEQHVEFLAGAAPAGTKSPSPTPSPSPRGRGAVPRNRERALASVARAERLLASAMTTHALAARSGAFARALGSMGAAAAQQAAALPAGGLDRAGAAR